MKLKDKLREQENQQKCKCNHSETDIQYSNINSWTP